MTKCSGKIFGLRIFGLFSENQQLQISSIQIRISQVNRVSFIMRQVKQHHVFSDLTSALTSPYTEKKFPEKALAVST